MKPRLFFWTVSLIALLLAVSCAPSVSTKTAPATVFLVPPAESTATEAVTAVPESEATPVPPAAQAIATSRGPNLEATDPTTVNLAAGQPQLVEFFRFT